jgi:asparagine synthase (glutamine-hydrolysing)
LLLGRERARWFSNPTLHWEHLALYPAEEPPLALGWPVEIRRPFADPRLHAFLLAVPPEFKCIPHPEVAGSYAGGKQLLRESLRGILPEPIRTKTAINGFNSAVSQQIDRNWTQYVETFGPTARPRVAERGYVDRDRFWARLQSLREGGSAAVRRDTRLVLYVIGLEQWLRGLELPRSAATNVVTGWRTPATSAPTQVWMPESAKPAAVVEQSVASFPLLQEVNV